jgi:hypothetical protein
MTKSSSGDWKNTLYCSFCGKSQHEVRGLIAGPTGFICNECVALCAHKFQQQGIACDYRPKQRSDEEIAAEARIAKVRRDRKEVDKNRPWRLTPDILREWPEERVRFAIMWMRFQSRLVDYCPPDVGFAEYISQHLTQEEAYRIFEQYCGGPGARFEQGIKMMFDPTAEQITAPFDRVVKLLRLGGEDPPENPL